MRSRRIGLHYFALYAPVAISISFLPLWLRDGGLSEQQVAIGIAAGGLSVVCVNLILPTAVAASGVSSARWVAAFGAGSALMAACAVTSASAASVVMAYLLIRLFSASLVPLSDSILLEFEARRAVDFGSVRLWGSASVVVVSLGMGIFVDGFGSVASVVALVACYGTVTLSALTLPPVGRLKGTQLASKAAVSGAGVFHEVTPMLLVAGAAQSAHGIFYAFSTFRWLDAGIDASVIGMLWALGVISEIFGFKFAARLFGGWSAGAMITAAAFIGFWRWGLLAASGSMTAAIAVQLLQGGSLAVLQIGAMRLIRERVPREQFTWATGHYASAVGLLGAVATFSSGLLQPYLGDHIFAFASCISLASAAVGSILLSRR